MCFLFFQVTGEGTPRSSRNPRSTTFEHISFSSAKGAYDIYILFVEQCLRLVREGSLIGLIVPNKYLAAPYAKSLREHLIEKHTIVRLRDVSRVGVFEDASVYPVISIIQRGQNNERYPIRVDQLVPEQIKTFLHTSDLLKSFPDYIWGFLLAEETELLQKLTRFSERLGSVSVSKVNATSTTSEADSYGPYITEEAGLRTEDGWKVVNTGLIERFIALWGVKILTHQGQQYSRPILPKQAPVVSENRFEQYSTPKLIFAKMALRIEAFVDREGNYASMNTNFALELSGGARVQFLGAVCNSRLLSWVYEQYFGALRMSGGYYQFQAPQLKVLPMRRISFDTPGEARRAPTFPPGRRRRVDRPSGPRDRGQRIPLQGRRPWRPS